MLIAYISIPILYIIITIVCILLIRKNKKIEQQLDELKTISKNDDIFDKIHQGITDIKEQLPTYEQDKQDHINVINSFQQNITDIKSEINSIKIDYINIKSMTEDIESLQTEINRLKRNIQVLETKLSESKNDNKEQLEEIIAPNNIVVDDKNINQQYLTIIETSEPEKQPKLSDDKIKDMIDNGQIIIK